MTLLLRRHRHLIALVDMMFRKMAISIELCYQFKATLLAMDAADRPNSKRAGTGFLHRCENAVFMVSS